MANNLPQLNIQIVVNLCLVKKDRLCKNTLGWNHTERFGLRNFPSMPRYTVILPWP